MRSLVSLVLILISSNAWADAGSQDVVGGSQVPRGRWPDAVAVIARDGVCTGTLVAADVVLTAGHCIEAMPIEVVVDTIDYAQPGGEHIRVAWSRAYPSWQQRYDVGVLMLEHPATTAKPRVVTSACTTDRLLETGLEVQIAGFGLDTVDATDENTRLHQATVPVIDAKCTLDPACNPAIAPRGEFMAGGRGADSCFGDSGGPVYVDTADGHGHALIGVVSRGLALPAAPCGNGGVYVRVDRVIAWIQSVTGRTLAKSSCRASATDDWSDDDSGGCAAGAGVGIGAALALLACAWLLYRRDRTVDLHDLGP